MRVFGIHSDGKFNEYVQTPFQVDHEESILEDWLEANPDGILEDGKILIIGRQVETNLGGYIDLLGVDREGNVVVIELKRDKTPRDTIAQSLEYVSFAARLDANQLEDILRVYLKDESLDLAAHHREYFSLDVYEAVAFNKDQRIVIVGQRIAPGIRQTAAFLGAKGVRVTCVEFTFFLAEGGTRLLSQEIVVGKESEKPTNVTSGSLPVTTEQSFLSSLDENGLAVFSRILEFGKLHSMPIHWGTKGLSLNVDIDGAHIALCFLYPPDSVYKQSFRTSLRDVGGVYRKSAVPEEVILNLWNQAQNSGLFVSAGRDLKCVVNRKLTEQEIESLLDWLATTEKVVKNYGLRQ